MSTQDMTELPESRPMWTIIDPDNSAAVASLPPLDEPLELGNTPPQQGSLLSGLFYFLISLLLATILAGQYLVYHFSELSQNRQLRPLLNQLCTTGICTLPPALDTRLVRSEELILQSHPELDNMLTLQMQFRNMATVGQALPAFDLVFTDIHGERVAARRFQPQDYLGGNADQSHALLEMPAGAVVMASLVFTDPGQHAVNYEVSFTAPAH